MTLADPVTALPGVGGTRARALRGMGIAAVGDMLLHYPRGYRDRSRITPLSELCPDAVQTVYGRVESRAETVRLNAKLALTKVKLRDGANELELVWFNQPYMKNALTAGASYFFTGKVTRAYGRWQMAAPEVEKDAPRVSSGDSRFAPDGPAAPAVPILPLYTLPASLSQKVFRSFVLSALGRLEEGGPPLPEPPPGPNAAQGAGNRAAAETERVPSVPGPNAARNNSVWRDPLPAALRARFNLCGLPEAVRNIHFPEDEAALQTARRRLVFEELFFAQLALFAQKDEADARPGLPFNGTDCAPVLAALPFALTNAQRKALADIAADLSSGFAMNRLLQGDVGSGKTAVVMAAAYLAAVNGYQSAVMAPTEILARQHYGQFARVFGPLNINVGLLTGAIPLKERRAVLSAAADGRASVVVGTHALIQSDVAFRRLGLAVTDEQHRFGVRQRLALAAKSVRGGQADPDGRSTASAPTAGCAHVLITTATPIPRTLGLILFGDMDVSVLDELPPGRRPIKTYTVSSGYWKRLQAFMQKEIDAGRQVYVICPVIEEGETEQPAEWELPNQLSGEAEAAAVSGAVRTAKELAAALPRAAVALLHGRMKPAEKSRVMEDFAVNRVNLLVATTVVEVGVHVANASLMVVLNAERFGLSQLHQLRGRVGRGAAQSYCVLVSDAKGEPARSQLTAMTQTNDGFVLAETDLRLRGAGDFFGTRQHGLPAFRVANLYRDLDALAEAQAAARWVKDPASGLPETERAACVREAAERMGVSEGLTL